MNLLLLELMSYLDSSIFREGSINQSEARKDCFLASDWLTIGTLPRNTVLYNLPTLLMRGSTTTSLAV